MKILVFFGLLPKSDFFRFRISVQRAVGGIRHPAEPTLVFVTGPVQSVLRVHTGHLGDLAENEQSVAQLLPDAVRTVHRLSGLHGLPQLGGFLIQLVQRTGSGVPVESGLYRAGDNLFRPPQRRQRMGDGFHSVRRGGEPLFLLF